MQKRKLGNSDLEITTVGLGAWAIGGDWKFGWGHQELDDSIAAIHAAIDGGINWIDTAHVYGFGRSEEAVGKAIQGRRDDAYIFTKCGRLRKEEGSKEIRGCLDRASVRGECEGSLRRLGVDVIDLYQIHWPDPDDKIEEAWEELQKLKEEGKIRWAGVSNFSVEQMKRIQPIGPITSLQPPYSMLRRGIEAEILPFCAESNIGTIVYSPMVSGLLTGKVTKEWRDSLSDSDFRTRTAEYNEPNLSINIDFVEGTIRPIADAHGVQPAQVAVAWVLRDGAPGGGPTAAIVGARRPSQSESNIKAAEVRLSSDEIATIDEAVERRNVAVEAAGGEVRK